MPSLSIDQQYCGPPNSGNGGYACGLLAQRIDGPSRVRLHAPPPLHTSLNIVETDTHVELRDDQRLIASAQPAKAPTSPPAAPSLAQACAAREHFKGFVQHNFTSCFVCGPQRQPGEGLCLFTGPVSHTNLVACDWIALPAFTDENGLVKPEFVWSALDCPSFFGLDLPYVDGKVLLLGEMQAAILQPLPSDQSLVVYGWKRNIEGRKHYAGAAIANANGDILAHAEHLWIEIK